MPVTDTGTGWKRGDTSRKAAEAIAGKAPTIKERVLACLHEHAFPLTAEEIARELQLPEVSVKPRISELVNDGRVRDSNRRKLGRWGKEIALWELI